jgi:hypothetical protein
MNGDANCRTQNSEPRTRVQLTARQLEQRFVHCDYKGAANIEGSMACGRHAAASHTNRIFAMSSSIAMAREYSVRQGRMFRGRCTEETMG